MQTINAQWGNMVVGLTWVPTQVLPLVDTVSSVHGFCFMGDKILMVEHPTRGWDFIGGHLEDNESITECFLREADEEANITGTLKMLGYVIVDNTLDPNYQEDSKYPPTAHQIFYRMDITRIDHFHGDFETLSRTLMNPQEIPIKHGRWNNIYQEILTSSLQA